jgi:hypothetical protein
MFQVEHLVTEMSAATDLTDARVRAGKVLQNFEVVVTKQATSDEVRVCSCARFQSNPIYILLHVCM